MSFDPTQITLDVLRAKHPERTAWEGVWADYELSYRGGYQFLAAAGSTLYGGYGTSGTTAGTTANPAMTAFNTPRRRFLRQLEGEPTAVYTTIWERAEYVNYLAAILDFHRHWLFSTPPNIRPSDGDDPPEWLPDFSSDANGSGTSFIDFVRDSFLDVLICRRSGWMVRYDEASKRSVLKPYRADEIVDWQKDEKGELQWVTLHKRETRRQFPDGRREVEVYTYCDREQWLEWEVVKNDRNEETLKLVDGGPLDLECVPFVMMEVPHGLWITDKLFAWQLGLFNQWTRLKSAMLLGCIMQPFIESNDPSAASRIFGEGILLNLRAADSVGGGKEEFGWKSPDVAPLAFIWQHFKEARDEGYRIVHQMALAVDSKAIGAIARSGASKIEDRKASEIILAAYGGYVRDAILRTVTLMSEVEGDDTGWVCDGFDNFNVSSLDEELQIAGLAKAMSFKSKTANKEIELQVIGRLLDHLDEKTKEEITEETTDAYEQEADQQMAPQMVNGVIVGQPAVGSQPVEGVKGVPGVNGAPGVGKPQVHPNTMKTEA